MKEFFYRDKDGKLVLRAIKSVGVDSAFRFQYKESPSSWPKNHPAELPPETIVVARQTYPNLQA